MRDSRWFRLPRILTRILLVIIGLAVGVNVATAIGAGVGLFGYAAIAATAVGVALGMRHPYAGLVIVAAAAPLGVLGGLMTTGLWSIACFAAFLFVLRGSSALIVGAVIAASNVAAAAWEAGTIDVRIDATASVAGFAAVVAVAIGSSVRGNLRYRREVEQRMHDSETNRLIAVERGIAQERLRIARDLHDSVGHQVAVVSMRLGAAEVHLPVGADSSRDDLAAARTGVQAVLRETQQILRVLRVGDDDGDLPSLQPLADLVGSYREAGMTVEGSIEEPPATVSPAARAAIYRIVQEGLTNAQRHGVGPISLVVAADDGTRIEIVNRRSGSAHRTAGGGNGLVGMRERAESVGGTFETRTDGRLFTLSAHIRH